MESKKDDYFIDGFLIRHFNIFPANFDKENLFEEQKIFLIYLMGIIPDFDSWRLNVDYKIRLDEIKKMKSVKIDDTILDMAKLQEKDLKQVEREELYGIMDYTMPFICLRKLIIDKSCVIMCNRQVIM